MFKGLLNKFSKKDLLNPVDESPFKLNTSSDGENLRKELIDDLSKYYDKAFNESLEASIKLLIRNRLTHYFFKKEYGEETYKDTLIFMENYKSIENIPEHFLIYDMDNLSKDYTTSRKFDTSSLKGTLWSNFKHLDLVSANRIKIQDEFTTILNNAKGEKEIVSFDLMPVVTPNNFVQEKEKRYDEYEKVCHLEPDNIGTYELFSVKLNFLTNMIYDSVKDELLAEFTKPKINLD